MYKPKKIIDLLNLIATQGQFHIFYELYLESAASLMLFRSIQKERGSEESINFYHSWLTATLQFCLTYSFFSDNPQRAERLYSLALHSDLLNQEERIAMKKNLNNINPKAVSTLDTIENNYTHREKVDFLSLTTEKQKAYYKETAKNMGMDPDDTDEIMGQIVARALKNYDPTEILINCEHLFVHYKPGGIVAQTLQLHSAGGMHLLVCLKHKHAQGTGDLLSSLYLPPSNFPVRGFKENHCVNCSDCTPRATGWKWSLAWHRDELPKHIEFLSIFKDW